MNDDRLIWNPFREDYLKNPFAQLRLWREHNPVHKGISNCWMLFKYDDVKFFLTDPIFKSWKTPAVIASKNTVSSRTIDFDSAAQMLSKWLLFLDPPEHSEFRSVIIKIWNSYKLEEYIQEIVAETLDSLEGKNEVDVLDEFSSVIPTRLICRILGLPPEDYGKLRSWSQVLFRIIEPFESLNKLRRHNEVAAEFYDYLKQIIRLKHLEPDDSFIGNFVRVNETLEKPFSRDEMISTMSFMFFAGIESSVNLFSQTILLLLKNPDHAAFVRENEILPMSAVNELVRYITPTQYTKRQAAEDIELRGKIIKKGEPVLGSLVSANHDPEVFEKPETLNLERDKNPHLSFGHGLHFCIGAKIARQEISLSIPAFMRRFPHITLQSGSDYQWDKYVLNRSLKSLTVSLNK